MTNNNHPDDKIDYYQEQKHGIAEVFVCLRLPIKHYETAYAFHKIANYGSFDDYVSHCVMNDIEMMLDNGEMTHDLVCEKLTGNNSPWAQNQKEHWKGVNKRLKKYQKVESGV